MATASCSLREELNRQGKCLLYKAVRNDSFLKATIVKVRLYYSKEKITGVEVSRQIDGH